MGEKERRLRSEKATQEGRQAYKNGISLDNNPYKISVWGMGSFWKMGWEDESCPQCHGSGILIIDDVSHPNIKCLCVSQNEGIK